MAYIITNFIGQSFTMLRKKTNYKVDYIILDNKLSFLVEMLEMQNNITISCTLIKILV